MGASHGTLLLFCLLQYKTTETALHFYTLSLVLEVLPGSSFLLYLLVEDLHCIGANQGPDMDLPSE